jgi:hypothetical protein
MKIYFGLLTFLLPLVCFAGDNQLLRTKMVSDLDVIKNTFEVKYAPVDWKKKYAQWDLEEKISETKTLISADDKITVKGYQQLLKNFFNSTKDYHVSIMFHSTAMAFLPFRVQSTQGRYFVVWVDRHDSSNPLSIGDEILTFNGKPVAEAVDVIKAQELGNPNSKTDQAIADMYLTTRVGAFGMDAPQGSVDITVKHVDAKNDSSYKLSWYYLPEEVNNQNVYRAAAVKKPQPSLLAVDAKSKSLIDETYFHRPMTAPFYEKWHAALQKKSGSANEGEADPVGARKSFIPPLGQVIWKSSDADSFYAYLFKTPDQKTVGYIRIPSYSGNEKQANEFLNLIKLFELRTDALVIDEVDNPGGEILYMYALASMLIDKPLEMPTHRETITQEDVVFALHALKEFDKTASARSSERSEGEQNDKTISGYPITPELIANLTENFQFIIDEWNAGHAFTSPHYLYGIKQIQPHVQSHYSKPILVLVNEMSISCGDFFPAMMQDNKRAKIFGARTAGAGGFVLTQMHPNRFGIESYSFTASLVERKDGNPIENLGVTPDIQYEITPEDLQQGYKGYVGEVQKALKDLLKK